MAGDKGFKERYVFDEDNFDSSGIGYTVFLGIRPSWRGRVFWFLANALDLFHGVAIWTLLFGLTSVVAVACQYDPTLLDERSDVAELATHWRGGLLIAAMALPLIVVSGTALVALCRRASVDVPQLTYAPETGRAKGSDVSRITRAALQARIRRSNRRVLVGVGLGSISGGLVLMAYIGSPVWQSGIGGISRFLRVLFTPLVGFLGVLVVFAAVALIASTYFLVRLASSFTRGFALKGMVRVNAPEEGAERTGIVNPDRPRVAWVDPALLAYLSTKIPGSASHKGTRVSIGSSGTTVRSRTLTGWMVALSVWALVEEGLFSIAVDRRGVLRRARIVLVRSRAGAANGAIAGYLTSLPTDDPTAFVDEDTVDRLGPVGDLITQIRNWKGMSSDDPDWKLASATFDNAVAAGLSEGDDESGYVFNCSAICSLLDRSQQLQHSFERAMRKQPKLMRLILRDGQRCVKGLTSLEYESGQSVRSLLLLAYQWLERRRRIASRSWPSCIC